jgi:hypothetical protein
MAENFAFIEFQLCLRWIIGRLLALCKKLGKKYIKKNSVGFLKNRHLLKGDFLKKSTPFRR